ncbi:hypothetical protein C0993_009323 [Termitomyces sp. T159_Od127]|nr:hypothetical protein C0993_009323 [Termitomyces sp. T159_Od127]
MEHMDTMNTADAELEKALSHLEEHGVLQHKNSNESLNPINEDKMYANGTKEVEIEADIFLAVVERCKAEENREEKAGDAVDDSEVIDERPSCREALNAANHPQVGLYYGAAICASIERYFCELRGPDTPGGIPVPLANHS